MDAASLTFVVAVLALVVALLTFVVLRLAAIVSAQEYLRSPTALPAGSRLPNFSGLYAATGEHFASDGLAGQASVLLFLSPDCGDCRQRVEELNALYPALQRSGVQLCVISTRSRRRMTAFLGESPLLAHVVLVSVSLRQRLNPRNAAPFYIFADHELRVLASDFIGDENWRSFVAQVGEEEKPSATI